MVEVGERIERVSKKHQEAGEILERLQSAAFPNPADVKKLAWRQHEINLELISIIKTMFKREA